MPNMNNIMIVSDIDDTIKWSHILAFPEVIADGLNYRLAFKGMPELYTALAKAGAKVVYVTGALDLKVNNVELDELPRKVISTNHFPGGDKDIYLHQRGESTEEFKVATISRLMKDNPGLDFILIGDNGQKDIETYWTLRQDPEIGSRVEQVFIHKIYNGGKSLEPRDDQHSFVTAAELAAMVYGLGFLSDEDLSTVVKIVDEGMNDRGENHKLTLPYAAQLVPAQVDAIYGSLPKTVDPPTQKLLDDIHKLILEQAKQGHHLF